MSDVVVSVTESTTNVTVTEQDVAVAVTETNVDVSASSAGIQGASYTPGDPIYVTVRNATGATLPLGTIVYTSGGNGTHTQVSPALATSDATSARVLGWLAESIANNASGLCQVEGYLDGVDTQGIANGTQLYLSGTVAGAFQTTKPQAPVHLVYVGVAVKASAGNGRVYVKVQNGYELDELHDVQITSVANNDLIKYDSATSLWKNVQPSTLSVGTAVSISGNITQSQVTNLTTDLAGKAALGTANTFTVGGHVINTGTSATKGLIIKRVAGQTANLLEFQLDTGTIMSRIDSSGDAYFGLINSSYQVLINSGGSGILPLRVRGAASQSANLLELQTSDGVLQTAFSPIGYAQIGAGTNPGGQLGIPLGSASNRGIVIRGAASQSANLQEWQNSAGTILAKIESTGAASFSSGNATITSGGIIRGLQVSTNVDYSSLREENSGGLLRLTKQTAAAANPASGQAKIYLRDGTTVGTLKLVVRAGAAGAETTILDNIPQ